MKGGIKAVLHPVVRTILQRLGLGLITLFVVSLILFSSIEFLPGDFGEAVLGQAALPETVAAFRKELGLDLPMHERYFDWLGGILTGDPPTDIAAVMGAFVPENIASAMSACLITRCR